MDDERAELLGCEGFEARNRRLRRGLVDEQRPRLVRDHELDLVAVHLLGHLEHLDALRGDAPDVGVLAQAEGVVRSGQRQRIGQWRDRSVRNVLVDDEAPIGERDELDLVTGQPGRLRARDGVPFALARDPVDADDLPERVAWVDRLPGERSERSCAKSSPPSLASCWWMGRSRRRKPKPNSAGLDQPVIPVAPAVHDVDDLGLRVAEDEEVVPDELELEDGFLGGQRAH